jgi:hypothetical protein
MFFDDLVQQLLETTLDAAAPSIKVLDMHMNHSPESVDSPELQGIHAGWADVIITDAGKQHPVCMVVHQDSQGEHDVFHGTHAARRGLVRTSTFTPQAWELLNQHWTKIFTPEFYYRQQVRSHVQHQDDLGFGDVPL